MATEKILIAIVDDHTLFRNGVAGLMSEFDELEVIFEAENGQQMQNALAKHALPDVVLMDINMPVMDGYDATAWLKKNYPQVKVLALSMFEDDKAVIKMIRNGASGYVLKESKPAELLEAIKTIYAKGVYINELVSGKLIRSLTAEEDSLDFSKKELEFLRLCCSELTYKEIADKMFVSPRTIDNYRVFVSPRTIDNYREALFLKLNLKSRTGLVLYAIQNQIFTF
jgi:DNA-binding NarL/FixJ family response regulator